MSIKRPKATTLVKRTDRAKRPYDRLAVLFISVGVIVLAVGIGLSIHDWLVNRDANRQAQKLVSEANAGTNHSVPSTNKITANEFNNYQVGPSLPRYLFIPKIGVRAIVGSLGLTANNQLATPDNVFNVGWYKASAKPGQPGATVIDGHVSSWTTNGVFYSLKTLKPGDAIQIERGDGTMVNYKVVKTQTYNYQNVDMTAVLAPINGAKSGLNLITCTGDVIKGTNEFNERVVVFAEET